MAAAFADRRMCQALRDVARLERQPTNHEWVKKALERARSEAEAWRAERESMVRGDPTVEAKLLEVRERMAQLEAEIAEYGAAWGAHRLARERGERPPRPLTEFPQGSWVECVRAVFGYTPSASTLRQRRKRERDRRLKKQARAGKRTRVQAS